LHGPGIYVQVPTPERYAVHKLILALDRPVGIGKRDKDLGQAARLLEVLAERRPDELRHVWEEAYERGPKWRKSLLDGLRHLSARARDLTLKTIGRNREISPQIDLTFRSPPVLYDAHRELVRFAGESLGSSVECAVSREALADHFGADHSDRKERLEAFQKERSRIERLLRSKYLHRPIEDPESVLLTTRDVEELSTPDS
jgi:hypothetical protein